MYIYDIYLYIEIDIHIALSAAPLTSSLATTALVGACAVGASVAERATRAGAGLTGALISFLLGAGLSTANALPATSRV